MYIRKISRHNKNGSTTTYVQLAHNVRDPKSGYARAQVLYSFGREESVDVEAIKRLVRSLCRFISPEETLKVQAFVDTRKIGLKYIRSVAMGGAYVLRKLWERLGLEKVIEGALATREFIAASLSGDGFSFGA